MIGRMKVCLFGVMAHLTTDLYIATGIKMNPMTELGMKTVLSYSADAGMTTIARRNIVTSVRGQKVWLRIINLLCELQVLFSIEI